MAHSNVAVVLIPLSGLLCLVVAKAIVLVGATLNHLCAVYFHQTGLRHYESTHEFCSLY